MARLLVRGLGRADPLYLQNSDLLLILYIYSMVRILIRGGANPDSG